jgi:hypothetical protein
MKFKFILIACLLTSIHAFSQSKNNISFVFGASSCDVNIHGAIGDYGYVKQNGVTNGLSYIRTLNKSFSLEVGVLYSDDKVRLSTIQGGGEQFDNQNLHLWSFPVMVRYTFLKYAFLQGGTYFDFQSNYGSNTSNLQKQSGVGLELGLGGKYNFGPVGVFINPYFVNHAFYASNNLVELGVKAGVGYNF